MKLTLPSDSFSAELRSDFSCWVRRRYSCRTFQVTPLSPEDHEFMNGVCASLTTRFAKDGLRFHLVSHAALRDKRMFLTGSYGMIRHTDVYLVGVAGERKREDWLRFGMAMETAVLNATARGIGSCWIGGIFDRRTFSRLLKLDSHEAVPAVVALGYPAERTSLRDRLVRWSARGTTRYPFGKLFFHNQWGQPLDAATYPRLTPLLESVRWAPSASNRQPWRIQVEDDRLSLYLMRTPGYLRLIPTVDLQAVDMGIAICHLEGSAVEKGISLISTGAPDPPGENDAEPVIRYSWK